MYIVFYIEHEMPLPEINLLGGSIILASTVYWRRIMVLFKIFFCFRFFIKF